jgi:hypothetical protein
MSAWLRARAKKSLNEATPNEGCTTKALGAPPKYAMWVKSRTGSKPADLFMAGASTWVDMPDSISVYPSGAERATASLPTMLPPPGRFSTMNCLPNAVLSTSANTRPSVSAAPPAPYGTTMRTGFAGQSCAAAGAAEKTATVAATAASMRVIVIYSALTPALAASSLDTSISETSRAPSCSGVPATIS